MKVNEDGNTLRAWLRLGIPIGIPIDPKLRSGHAWLRCIALSSEVPFINFFVAIRRISVDSEDGIWWDDIAWALGNPWLEVADGLIEIGSICLAAGLDWRNMAKPSGLAAVKHVWCFHGDFFSVKVLRQTGKWMQMLVHRIKFAEPAANILVYTLRVYKSTSRKSSNWTCLWEQPAQTWRTGHATLVHLRFGLLPEPFLSGSSVPVTLHAMLETHQGVAVVLATQTSGTFASFHIYNMGH